jgi:hypothetical protein
MGPIKEWLGKNLFGSLGGTDENVDSTPKKVAKVTDNSVAKPEESKTSNEEGKTFGEESSQEGIPDFAIELKRNADEIQRLEKSLESLYDPDLERQMNTLKAELNESMTMLNKRIYFVAERLQENVNKLEQMAKSTYLKTINRVDINHQNEILEKIFNSTVDKNKKVIEPLIKHYRDSYKAHKYITGKYFDIPREFEVSLRKLHFDVSGNIISESSKLREVLDKTESVQIQDDTSEENTKEKKKKKSKSKRK